MSKILIAVFVLLSITADVTLGLWTQETFHAANFWSNTELHINSDLPGKIKVHTGDYANVHLTVNKSASSQMDLDNIQVYVHRNDGGQFNITVYYGPPPTVAPTTSTSTPTTTPTDPTSSGNVLQGSIITTIISVLAVLGVIFIQDKRQYIVVILLMGVCFLPLLQLIQAQEPPSADIDIYIPKELILNSLVSIRASQASIKVAKFFFSEDYNETEFECFSSSIDTHQACPSCCNGQGQCVNGQCECSFGFNGTECQNQTLDTFQIFTNPLDPKLMAVFTLEGDEIVAMGNKSAVGLNSTITEFIVNDTEGRQTFTKMDSQGRVESAIDTDGNKMKETWEDGNSAAYFEVIYGTEQLNIRIDLATLDYDDADTNPPEGVEKRSVVPSLQYYDQPIMNNPPKTGSQGQNDIHEVTKRNTVGEETAFYVSVATCDEPVDGAAVSVDVYEYDKHTKVYSFSETYTAQPTDSSGQYKAVIPLAPAANSIEACDRIVSKIEIACQKYSLIHMAVTKGKAEIEKGLCAVLATAGLAITKIPSTWTVINRFCTTTLKIANNFCKVLDVTGKAVTDQSPSDLVCEAAATDLIDRFINDFTNQRVFLLKPKAIIQGNEVLGHIVTTELEEGEPINLSINQQFSTPQILSFYSVPKDPVPSQDYVATVTFTCYSPQTEVFMSVVGTDGYNNSITCTGGPKCGLHVSGAAKLVHDTVTVRITDTPGSQNYIERVIYLVF